MMNSIILAKLFKLLFTETEENITNNEYFKMLKLARKNKLLDMYLERVSKPSNDMQVSKLIVERKERETRFLKTLLTTAEKLDGAHIRHALFKTLKPFRFLPNDVDLLIFDVDDLEKAKKVLVKAGYKLDEYEPYVLSLTSPENMTVELHYEIPISYFVYLDRSILEPYSSSVTVDEVRVFTLNPSAELLCTIAHSLFKENIMTLADYTDIKTRIDQQLNNNLDDFKELTKKSYMELGVYLALKIALSLENKFLPNCKSSSIACLCEELRLDLNFTNIVDAFVNKLFHNPVFPYKLHPVISALIFTDKIIKDNRARSSLATQVFKTLDITNPYNRRLGELLISHIKKESY